MAEVRVVWDDAAVKLDCETPNGPVDRAMSRLADGAVLSMKFYLPVYKGPRRGPVPGHPRQAERASGTLRASVRKFRQADGAYLVGPTDMVGPPTKPPRLLGPMIAKGTEPHIIEPSGEWPLYNAATRQAFGRLVHHPGTRPNRFLDLTAESLNGITVRI